ncbi:MAG: ABC transporter permease [Defluviitaleaceae bacterium]|nr:ABC transporter permease [Defluviitaleaceae bacterium]
MIAKKLYLALIVFFLYAPILVLMVFSFNYSRSQAHWAGFSLRWYRELFNDDQIMRAVRNTVLIGIFSTVAATAIGAAAAVGISKMGRRFKGIVMGVTQLPVMMPDIVTGISLRLLFIFVIRFIGAGNLGFGTLLLSHIIFNVPYVILSVMPKLQQMDGNLYEAALDLGSTPFGAFHKVILPEVWPGVVTGALLAFTLSVDDFMVSFFTTGSGVENLSIQIFSMARRGVNPRINALSTLIFIVIMVLLFLVHKRDQRLARDNSA